MPKSLAVVGLFLLVPFTGAAQEGFQDPLLDRFAGSWVLRGTIAGDEIVHDLDAEWVLGHHYLRFHELARERDERGNPAYDAIVFIGWDEASGRYACLWLDSTGGDGLTNGVMGYAEPDDDTLAFVFSGPGFGPFHTSFAYEEESDSWQWTMDAVNGEERRPFARLRMTRR